MARMGATTRYTLMPPAFMAVISLRRASTPRVTSTATSTATGVTRSRIWKMWYE